MSDAAWDSLKDIFLAAIGGFVTVATAYIAARWNVSRRASRDSGDSAHSDKAVKK